MRNSIAFRLNKNSKWVVILLALQTCAYAQQRCNANVVSDTPTSRFSIHTDGTVTDLKTGLMWQRCLLGLSGSSCQSGVAQAWNWLDAMHAAELSTVGGYADWRVPNIKEMHSIIERRCAAPSINLEVFPGVPSSYSATYFWTSTPHASFPDRAWYVGLAYGGDNYAYNLGGLAKNSGAYVLFVRSMP